MRALRNAVSPEVMGRIITPSTAIVPPMVPRVVTEISLTTPAGPDSARTSVSMAPSLRCPPVTIIAGPQPQQLMLQLHITAGEPTLQPLAAGQVIDADSVGVFGFSRGGYTALALAGAVPSASASAARLCNRWGSLAMSLCRQLRSGDAALEPAADPRIRAAVVVDPLNLFDAAGLRNVRVPVQLWASELGGDGVALAHVEAVRTGLPTRPEYHVARGAGHFAYLVPCPPALQDSAPRICEDPDGFDRNAWHLRMNAFVVKFFRRHLQDGRQG